MIVDTHVHVVSDDESRYPLQPRGLPGAWYREAPCSVEQLLGLMDEARVDRAVLVQGVGAYSFDNRYAADSAAAHPDRCASVACIDLTTPDPVARLEHWVNERGMGGLRVFALAPPGESRLADPATFPVWDRGIELGVRFVVTIFTHQLPELETLLARYPSLPVHLDHCAFPELDRPDWDTPLRALARYENLLLKVTTHLIHSAEEHGLDPRDLVEQLVGHVGADRIMWGSDFSQTHDRPYPALVDQARHAFGRLPAAQQAQCLGGTALRVWPELSSPPV